MNDQVVIWAGEPLVFGSGHLQRMKDLQRMLRSRGVRVRLTLEQPVLVAGTDVLVIDRRNSAIPDLPAGCRTVLIDHRGKDRERADLLWDVLPHHDMGPAAFHLCMRRFLLQPMVAERPSLAFRSRIHYAGSHPPQPGRGDFLWLPPVKRGHFRPELTAMKFRSEILRAERVITYFGQLLFEAAYLGKEIVLYDITTYHRRLSLYFLGRVRGGGWYRNFDGRGIYRLTDQIMRSIRV